MRAIPVESRTYALEPPVHDFSDMSYFNSNKGYQPPPPVTVNDNLHEFTPIHEYDVNSFLPLPSKPLRTNLVALDPLIPILHADALFRAFSAPPVGPDPDAIFYPFPSGTPHKEKSETLIYLEKQRRRPNILMFAITDLKSGEFAGMMSLGCEPLAITHDVKLMSAKILPTFRGTHVFTHATSLLMSYALDPKAEGGLGVVRLGWRTTLSNIKSQKAALRMGFTREGIMRCYEVSSDIGDDTLYEDFTPTPDGTGRKTEDGIVYSMTVFDWLADGKRERTKAMVDAANGKSKL
ncbi:hypothetical protein H0H81_007385 [Sphagnurus paluster]|uniref:N-acetyltransferase domain-containing protein n=1 Tax=Sphagnurus paluster TaxID=117069 RepID=A0A9P7FQE9_9AGAR|nr:hypothetical protein H0H81_007385 [Sphagnurus paluster]